MYTNVQKATAIRKAADFFEQHPDRRVNNTYKINYGGGVVCFCTVGRIVHELLNGADPYELKYSFGYYRAEMQMRAELDKLEIMNEEKTAPGEPHVEMIAEMRRLADSLEGK